MRILFTSTHEAAFIRDDLRLLRKCHEVRPILTLGVSSLFRIIAGVLNADLTFTWFASVYSAPLVFISHLLGKRSIIVIGGVDAAYEPEFRYGIWVSGWKSRFVRYAVLHADLLLALTPFLRDQVKKLAQYRGENIIVLPTGYDPAFWVPGTGVKERMVLTVAACEDYSRMSIKGIPFLVEAARTMVDVPFVLIGPRGNAAELIRELRPPVNMTILPFMPREQLLVHYQKSAVYCQPSYYEGGLSSSLCESMLCGCVPVGTNVGGIPTAIGDSGFLVSYGDTGALVQSIRDALDPPSGMSNQARSHIATNFSLSRREELLLDHVAGVYR